VFVVDGPPLLPVPSAHELDAVILKDGTVAIASGCPPVPAMIRATPHGTIVRARWADCGRAKDVRLHARIEPSCNWMVGIFAVGQPPFMRRFAAARCNDPATCRRACESNTDCTGVAYCAKRPGHCQGKGVCAARPDVCPDVYLPECGCDGHTYGNACEAAAAGVNVWRHGECVCDPVSSEPCRPDQFCETPPGICDPAGVEGMCVDIPAACPDVYRPVCGCDGLTYPNDCDRLAAGVSKAHDGPCPVVCGTIAGITCPAGQFCEFPPAMCGGADLAGICLPVPQACPRVFDPVCGCDGITYPNDCERLAAQVALDHRGPCTTNTAAGN
jgi:hypothetical protein